MVFAWRKLCRTLPYRFSRYVACSGDLSEGRETETESAGLVQYIVVRTGSRCAYAEIEFLYASSVTRLAP
jgi:hypothetical protein